MITTALIISTYNWPIALDMVLKSIVSQSILPDQIIIADDGSSKETASVVKKYTEALPIQHIWHEDKGFRKTIILNKALAACTTDYIIEIDGDIIVHKHFIRDHIKAAQKGFFVQGSRAMMGESLSNKVLNQKISKINFLTKGMTTRFNAIRLPFLSCLFKTNPYSSKNVKGCNIAFWREDYIRINGYFNGFTGWGWEDYEFAERLINSGIRKKRLKLAAIGYHIYHPLSSRKNFKTNELIYEETVQKKICHRVPGFNEIISA